MSQLVRDFDFGIGSEASRRLAAGTVVVEITLEHDGLLQWKERANGPSLADAHIACQQ
jgi:hypothetical protein